MPCFEIIGDMLLTDDGSDVLLVEGIDAIKQSLRTGALVFRGLWIYDTKAGIPYLDAAFDKGADLDIVETVFRTYLLDTPGVAVVERLNLNFDEESRILYVDFTVRTELGESLTDTIPYPILSA